MSIFEIRKKLGLSQRQFATKFHINIKTLQSWEQGIRNCPEWTIWMINRIVELEKDEDKL